MVFFLISTFPGTASQVKLITLTPLAVNKICTITRSVLVWDSLAGRRQQPHAHPRTRQRDSRSKAADPEARRKTTQICVFAIRVSRSLWLVAGWLSNPDGMLTIRIAAWPRRNEESEKRPKTTHTISDRLLGVIFYMKMKTLFSTVRDAPVSQWVPMWPMQHSRMGALNLSPIVITSHCGLCGMFSVCSLAWLGNDTNVRINNAWPGLIFARDEGLLFPPSFPICQIKLDRRLIMIKSGAKLARTRLSGFRGKIILGMNFRLIREEQRLCWGYKFIW